MILRLLRSLKTYGFGGFIENKLKIRLPRTNKNRWRYGIKKEVQFWDEYFRTKGLEWKDQYHLRLDKNLELQADIAALLPNNPDKIKLLDVGAGPLTFVGKVYKKAPLEIIAIDPLADEYKKILDKYSVIPIIETQKISAEKISTFFPENSFDIVTARNCIDHSISPERSILEMIKVVKKNCCVYMMHRPNEAINENYAGLHQWNFSCINNDFIISSKKETVNFSQKYKQIADIKTTLLNEDNWIISTIYKK